jgi:putative tricarboxylic transport membrane protein
VSMMVSLSSERMVKGLLMGVAGLAVSLVGLDPIMAYPRLTFGSVAFVEGVSFIPVMVGLFGVAEVLMQVYARPPRAVDDRVRLDAIWPSRDEVRRMAPHAVLGSAIGTWVGVIPGAGGDIGSVLAWGQSRRLSRDPAGYGRGSLAGLAASCTAANAAIGGAMMTMLTLGVPGDAASAVLIGALLIQGVQPGPLLFRDRPDLAADIVVLLLMAASVSVIVGLLGARALARILKVKDEILWGLILVTCVLGSYALNGSVADVWVMLGAGVLGFVLRQARFPMGPLVLGLILGPMAESNLRRALVVSQGDPSIFLTRPIAAVLLAATVVSLAWPIVTRRATRRSP